MKSRKTKIVSLSCMLLFALGLLIQPKAQAFDGSVRYKLEICLFSTGELGSKCGDEDENGNCDRTTSCTPDDAPVIE